MTPIFKLISHFGWHICTKSKCIWCVISIAEVMSNVHFMQHLIIYWCLLGNHTNCCVRTRSHRCVFVVSMLISINFFVPYLSSWVSLIYCIYSVWDDFFYETERWSFHLKHNICCILRLIHVFLLNNLWPATSISKLSVC